MFRRVTRRQLLASGGAMLAGGLLGLWKLSRRSTIGLERGAAVVRPPSASHDDAAFRAKCIRCGLCGTVCENGCIRFFGLDETEHGSLTPYLDVRRRSCTLCMRCTQICPSGALQPIVDDLQVIAKTVRMGKAKVERELCLSYLGRVCGYCHDACPLPGEAIKLTPPGLPVIQDACVGCGRCVELCPQHPSALRLVSSSRRSEDSEVT